MDNKILLTNTHLDIDEITEKVNALRKAILDRVEKVLPMVINAFKSMIRALRTNAFMRAYRRKNIKRLYKLGEVYYKNKYPPCFFINGDN